MQNAIQIKIINLADFFKHISGKLRQETKFKRFYFLVPNDKNGDFITKYSTCGSHIRLAKKKMRYLNEYLENGIFYPKIMFQRCSFLRRVIFRITWKTRLHNASVIMPIYGDSGIICLVLFADKLAEDWLDSHSSYIDVIRQEFTCCLEGILLYNQTMERIIREYYS